MITRSAAADDAPMSNDETSMGIGVCKGAGGTGAGASGPKPAVGGDGGAPAIGATNVAGTGDAAIPGGATAGTEARAVVGNTGCCAEMRAGPPCGGGVRVAGTAANEAEGRSAGGARLGSAA